MDENSNHVEDPRPVDERGGQGVNPWPFVAVMLGMVAILLGLVVMTTGRANASTWQQPYGGCREAIQAPQSVGADECRSHRWIVRSRIVVNPHGYVVATTLKACRLEDSPRCYWDAGVAGNGRGHSFVNLGPTDGTRLLYVKGFRWSR